MCNEILKIALDVPMDSLFDYSDGGMEVNVGQRVLVPFGNKSRIGVVVGKTSVSKIPLEKLKAIKSVYNDEPLIDEELFSIIKFASEYYQYPFGQALINILPSRLRQIKPAKTRYHYSYEITELGIENDAQSLPPRKVILKKIFYVLKEKRIQSESELGDVSKGWRGAIKTLIEFGFVKEVKQLPVLDISDSKESNFEPTLNLEQKNAIEQVVDNSGKFSPYLLYGITGSGKTEVYMQILKQVLSDNNHQALVLVPEINLTPQLESRFKSRLKHLPIVSLHSNLNESERLHNWVYAQSGKARIIIGTRLSVFAQLPKLKIIIVDEEHDGSYKQQEGMRYHARDIALLRAQQLKIPIIMGSATPSLETWYNTKIHKYALLTLCKRAVTQAALPNIRCLDISKTDIVDGMTSALTTAIQDRLNKGEQSMLFINRRGYSPVLLCRSCHWIASCKRCSCKLVVHLNRKILTCHHCGQEQRIIRQCPNCGDADLCPTGYGTQRIEDTLKKLFPAARVQRVDRDSTRGKDKLSDILSAVVSNKVDILVGTQMLAKGHDFPNLTLVGVIDTDSALFSPDFRASERLFSQLMQVSGRAGRAEKPGEVLIQTAFPEHNLFNALRNHDYANFAEVILKEREMTEFPPYSYLAMIRAEAINYDFVYNFLKYAHEIANLESKEVLTYDPVRPQIERIKGKERGYVLMQATQRRHLHQLLSTLIPKLRETKLGSKIRWNIDIDPQELG